VEFLAWLEVNKLRVIAVAGIIGAVAAAISVYRWHTAEVERQAGGALLKAQSGTGRGENSEKPVPGALLRVASEFPGTSAGARAMLLAAAGLFEAGKYAEARGQFQQFLTQYEDNSFAGSAAYGIAASLDAEGKTNDAFTAYQNVVTRYGSSAPATQARLALASLCEARNDFAQALRLYGEVPAPGMPSLWGSEAAQRREELLRHHPELARTNAPLVAPLASSLGTSNVSGPNPPSAPATNR